MRPDAVFFDLDGTLADTAEDLAAPVNAMRVNRGLPPLPVAQLRPFASMGARGLIGRALDVEADDPRFAALRDEFLQRYEAALVVHTRLFDGMPQVLDRLDAQGLAWGVVSNKVERYVRRIMQTLGLLGRGRTAVGGDTTPHAKPHPAPLLHAARTAGIDPGRCVYVGDDLRDVQAGHAAGMTTVAAAYGYCGDALAPANWGAHHVIGAPLELISLLNIG
jgi:N-acetyl-D-muramate 6-phosphate phosphatase